MDDFMKSISQGLGISVGCLMFICLGLSVVCLALIWFAENYIGG